MPERGRPSAGGCGSGLWLRGGAEASSPGLLPQTESPPHESTPRGPEHRRAAPQPRALHTGLRHWWVCFNRREALKGSETADWALRKERATQTLCPEPQKGYLLVPHESQAVGPMSMAGGAREVNAPWQHFPRCPLPTAGGCTAQMLPLGTDPRSLPWKGWGPPAASPEPVRDDPLPSRGTGLSGEPSALGRAGHGSRHPPWCPGDEDGPGSSPRM